ncbi:hypothetical protein B0H16DRAFT_1576117 [Mycena metata]|uniref:Uncharacterized protein n=1 Tax=Mycena metata TaxID=1033252 RepID=A0AAD7I5D9_9AGAR|nr:hypothetical protein B0H16DRAFT_1576117 [Mycena metata]
MWMDWATRTMIGSMIRMRKTWKGTRGTRIFFLRPMMLVRTKSVHFMGWIFRGRVLKVVTGELKGNLKHTSNHKMCPVFVCRREVLSLHALTLPLPDVQQDQIDRNSSGADQEAHVDPHTPIERPKGGGIIQRIFWGFQQDLEGLDPISPFLM